MGLGLRGIGLEGIGLGRERGGVGGRLRSRALGRGEGKRWGYSSRASAERMYAKAAVPPREVACDRPSVRVRVRVGARVRVRVRVRVGVRVGVRVNATARARARVRVFGPSSACRG